MSEEPRSLFLGPLVSTLLDFEKGFDQLIFFLVVAVAGLIFGGSGSGSILGCGAIAVVAGGFAPTDDGLA